MARDGPNGVASDRHSRSPRTSSSEPVAASPFGDEDAQFQARLDPHAAANSAAAAAEPQPAQVRASFLSSTPGIPLPSPPPPSPSTTTACADAPANIAEGCCSDPPDPRDPPGAGLRSLPGPGLGSAPRSGLGPWVRAWIRAGAVPHGVEASLHTSSPSPPYAPLGGAGRVGGAAAAPPMATRPHHAPPSPYQAALAESAALTTQHQQQRATAAEEEAEMDIHLQACDIHA